MKKTKVSNTKLSARPRKSSSAVPPSGFKLKFQESEQRYQTLLKQLPVGIYRSTPEGRIIEVNPALAKILGYSEAELKKLDAHKLYYKKKDRDIILGGLEEKQVFSKEFRLRRKDGGLIWVHDYCQAVAGPSGRIEYYDGILVDISREKKAEATLKVVLKKLKKSNSERQQMIQKLRSSSITDELTGLYNRRGFFTITREYLNLAVRKKIQMFLLYIDMDELKRINDTLGHHVGDEALKQFAEILRTTFRNSDIMGRMGGDEFAIFPIDSTSAGVEAATSRLEKNITAFNSSGRSPFKLAISLGVSCFDPKYPSSMEDVLIRADKLMYDDKVTKRRAESGSGRV